jgi:MFS family permease
MSTLLKQKRFGPLFLTQFLGAFNDNVYKNALVILLAYKATTEAESGFLVSLAGGVFILPFLLFSSLAGQLSDKFEKSKFVVKTKILEVVAMALGVVGFYLESTNLLISVLFLMGIQSTFFGPNKYSILPQVLKEEKELMEGTALVEMGTFLAILLGTILGGVLLNYSTTLLCISIFLLSVLGYFSSLGIPPVSVSDSSLKIKLNPLSQVSSSLKVSLQNRSVVFGILSISWFWFLGAVYLSQIPVFVKYFMNAEKVFVSILLSVFTFSLAIGSIFCNKLSQKVIELGLVPIGCVGMALFGFDLLFIDYSVFKEPLMTVAQSFQGIYFPVCTRLVIDFFFVGFFGSFYIVPVYAILQRRSSKENCSQVIASNNILNAIFMIFSALSTMAAYKLGYKTNQIFAGVSVLNLIFLVIFISFMPELIYRTKFWLKKRLGSYPVVKGHDILRISNLVVVPNDGYIKFLEVVSVFKGVPVKLLTCDGKDNLFKKIYCSALRVKGNVIIDNLRKGEVLCVREKNFSCLDKVVDKDVNICQVELSSKRSAIANFVFSTR